MTENGDPDDSHASADPNLRAIDLSRRRVLALSGALAGSLAGCSGSTSTDTATPDSSPTPSTSRSPATSTSRSPATSTSPTGTSRTRTGTTTPTAEGDPYDIVVAKDGSGDVETVGAAIESISATDLGETTVYIKKGRYKEKLRLPRRKTNVTFVGEDATETVLTYDDHADKTGEFGVELGTSGSYSFFVQADGFTARNLTFENAAKPVAQAVAMMIKGDRAVFENCRFLGNQDTLYTRAPDSRQYYRNCYVEGDVDFIFGASTAFFEDCEIFCKPDGGYVTAASTPSDHRVGYVFRNCRVTGNAPEDSYYLGRPWKPYANVVFVHTHLGDHVKPEGWDNWDDPAKEATAFFAEHENEGPGWTPTKRVDWAHFLEAEEVSDYSLDAVFPRWDLSKRLGTDDD